MHPIHMPIDSAVFSLDDDHSHLDWSLIKLLFSVTAGSHEDGKVLKMKILVCIDPFLSDFLMAMLVCFHNSFGACYI